MKILSSPFSFRGKSYLGEIYRPYVEFLISSDKVDEWIPIEMVVDTGADYSLFPQKYSELLGINTEKECFLQTTYGVGGKEAIYLYRRGIKTKVGNWQERIPLGFLGRDDVSPLLGRLNCLEVLTLVMKDHITTLEK